MRHQSSATIFLAEQYHIFQTEERRSISVVNETARFTDIRSVQDETLVAGESVTYHSTGNLILLPLVGTMVATINGAEQEVDCGELITIGAGTSLKVYNPYKDHLVNYLLIYLNNDHPQEMDCHKHVFNLNSNRNELVEVFCANGLKLCLGKLEMRREVTYYPNGYQNTFFCFVIQGSFEIEGRLLHERDSLAIWNTNLLDIESLGWESILLLIELSH